MLPYGRQWVDESDIDAVAAVLRGDWLTTGPAVDTFEAALAEVTGSTFPAVSVTSGTAALHVAYAALGVGPGDTVVTTPLTFVATASTASILGATLVFADVSEDTGNLDPDAVDAVLDEKVRVVAGVDFGGHPIDAPALRAVAGTVGAVVLEDAAHALGGSLDGIPVGSLSDVTTLSFFPTKNITTAEGGAVVSADAELLARARTFRTIGLVRDPDQLRHPELGPWHQEVQAFGLNYRLPDVLAALGASQLRRLDAFRVRRQELHDRYTAALAEVPELRTPTRRPGAEPCWHLYPVRVLDGRRRELFEHLREHEVGVQVNYLPVYWHPVYADLGYRRGLCPVAEEYAAQELSLPLFPALADADADRVIDLVRSFFGA